MSLCNVAHGRGGHCLTWRPRLRNYSLNMKLYGLPMADDLSERVWTRDTVPPRRTENAPVAELRGHAGSLREVQANDTSTSR